MKQRLLLGFFALLTHISWGQCVPAVKLSIEKNPICTLEEVTLTATVTANGGAAPSFAFTDGFFLNQDGPQNTATLTGFFSGNVTVEMTVNDGCANGSKATDVINVVVVNPPNPVINETSQDICDGQTFELTANVGTSNTYEWYKDGSPTGNMTTNYNVTEAGDYSIKEDNGGCEKESDTRTIGILDVPTVDAGADVTVAPGGSVMLNATSDYTTNIVWTPDTYLDNPNILNPTCSPPTDGNTTLYTVTSYNEQCSGSDQIEVKVSFVTAIGAFGFNEQIIYPNPASQDLVLPFAADSYHIFNAEGESLLKGTGVEVDVTNLPEGLYQIVMIKNSERIAKKFTIAR